MVRFGEIYGATRKAFAANEFYELLTGREGYDIPVLDAPTTVPTDWTALMSNGIFALYKNESSHREKIQELFYRALEKMIEGDTIDMWESSYIIFIFLKGQKRGTAPFSLDTNVVKKYSSRIEEKKNHCLSVLNMQEANILMVCWGT